MPVFLILPGKSKPDFERTLLGITVAGCIQASLEQAGYQGIYDPADRPVKGAAAVIAPAPLLEKADWDALAAADGPARLVCGGETLAVAGPGESLAGLLEPAAWADLEEIEVPPERGILASSAGNTYLCQSLLMEKIMESLWAKEVTVVHPGSTFVSPTAQIAPGCQILPGCQIYGKTTIGANSVIGPNCLLQDAEIGEHVRVNASQIYESSVGGHTTVGPFAYIRPGCKIGEKVRIGDFVELKNTRLGRGTKVSHLTYLGDSDFGEGINVGCGVVTSNYDGYKKHLTVVGDNSFIGCNVNLVPPVTVEQDAYIAAGTTVTDTVPAGSLAIGRAKQENKPGWVAKWREKNKK